MGLVVALGVLVGCSSSSGSGGGSGGNGGASGTAGSGGTAGNGGMCGSKVALTVKNFDAWCSFTVNGTDMSSSAQETVCVSPGTVKLAATALPGFVLGSDPWHDTDTHSGASATVKVTSGTKCVWVCCPGSGGTPACPTSDQCP